MHIVGHRQKGLGPSNETLSPTSFEVLPLSTKFFGIM